MTWEEAMWKYGNDKPDIRFEMKLANLKVFVYVDGKIQATGETDRRKRISRYLIMPKPYWLLRFLVAVNIPVNRLMN